MAQQRVGMFTTKKDQEQFDNWTKEEIYEAYLVENRVRIRLNKENIKFNQQLFNQSTIIKELSKELNREE